MTKPRIFLGSSGKQAKLLQAITRGVVKQDPPHLGCTPLHNPGK